MNLSYRNQSIDLPGFYMRRTLVVKGLPGPILESKGMRAIFQKKGQIFEILGKNVQNLKIFSR